MKKTFATVAAFALLLFASIAWALPSEKQVQDAVKQGNFVQAESMMAEVVGAKPGSAKAHYVYAELLAHNGNFNKASAETAKARELDPAIGFTDPSKFKSFEETLKREQSGAQRPRAAPSTMTSTYAPQTAPAESVGGGIPSWVWLVGLVLVAAFIWRGFSRSREQGAMAASGMAGGYGPGAVGPAGAAPYGPYGPGGAPMGRPGSGLLGTGLAVAGGVAGGMLLDEMLNKHGSGNASAAGFADQGSDSDARALEDRQVDFGNGNDWDSGGGSVDMGGGSDGGGSWD